MDYRGNLIFKDVDNAMSALKDFVAAEKVPAYVHDHITLRYVYNDNFIIKDMFEEHEYTIRPLSECMDKESKRVIQIAHYRQRTENAEKINSIINSEKRNILSKN